jgi:hypothetical protein
MFGFGKKKVTTSQMAQGLWMFCRKFSNGFYEGFKPKIEKAGFNIDEVDVCNEIIMMNLWIICKSLSHNPKVLNELQKIYILGFQNFGDSEEEKKSMSKYAESEINIRFDKYNKTWKDNSGDQILLAMDMLSYMLNKGLPDKKLVNIQLSFYTNVHIISMMKAAKDFFEDFQLVDK